MFFSPLETHELYKFIGKITKCARYRLKMGDKWVRNKWLELFTAYDSERANRAAFGVHNDMSKVVQSSEKEMNEI